MIINEKTKKDIPLDTIVYVESSSNYCTFHRINVIKNKLCYARPLKDIEARFGESFTRIHARYLVNNQFVTSFDDERVFIEILNLTLQISRRKRLAVHKSLLDFANKQI